jgi:hypothetical protein
LKTFKRIAVRMMLLAALAGFRLPAGLLLSQNKAPEPKILGPLIRMDLLERAKPESGQPTRNIFAPKQAYDAPAVARQEGQSPMLTPDLPSGVPQAPGQGGTEPPPAPGISLDLRYIGFVNSPKKMIALIILQGQTLAVAEGEVVSEGIRIGKITKGILEVIMPDSSKRSFSLEGEEP